MFHSSLLIIFFATCSVYCNVTSTDSLNEINSDLNAAVDLILKAKDNIPEGNKKAADCFDLLKMGHTESGIYEIWPINRLFEGKSLNVYCDMDTDGGGWTVIQRRGDFGRSKDYFYKDWQSYKEGFGDREKDFWLGNDNIFALTNQRLYSARFDLKDVEQNRSYALYGKFWIDDENSKYTLHIDDYSGNAGDAMIRFHNSEKFTTKDRDNDNYLKGNCALLHKGGWWYKTCCISNLNGMYHKGKYRGSPQYDGIFWSTWKGYRDSLEWTEIKIRPKIPENFLHHSMIQ